MDFRDTLSIIGALILLATFAGSAAVFIKGSVYKGAIAAQDVTINALKLNNETLTIDMAKVKSQLEIKDTRIDVLENDNKLLATYRPSAEVIKAISTSLDKHHEYVVELLRSIINDK